MFWWSLPTVWKFFELFRLHTNRSKALNHTVRRSGACFDDLKGLIFCFWCSTQAHTYTLSCTCTCPYLQATVCILLVFMRQDGILLYIQSFHLVHFRSLPFVLIQLVFLPVWPAVPVLVVFFRSGVYNQWLCNRWPRELRFKNLDRRTQLEWGLYGRMLGGARMEGIAGENDFEGQVTLL